MLETINYSLYSIPVAWVVAVLPQAYALHTFNAYTNDKSRGWDNVIPRTNCSSSNLKANGIPNHIADRIIRATSASSNGLENLSLFAAGVVAANYAQLSTKTINTLCLTYLASRIAYNLLYINTTTQRRSHYRSVAFYVGHICVMALFSMSGNVLYNR